MLSARSRLALLACLAGLAGCGSGGSGALRPRGAEVRLPTAPPHTVAHAPTAAPPARRSRPTPASAPTRPRIVSRPIPFGDRRRREMAAYARRHYGTATYLLTRPRVIVEHYTGTQTFSAAYDMFAPDHPDLELHELPNICSHFVVDRDGTIYQVVPLGYMCRHTVGLNYTAIGIEHVGTTDAQVLRDRRQLAASLRLTRWLRCRYGVRPRDVIGHNESLGSPYHRENVARLRNQTHPDWTPADMDVYRAKLRRLGGC